MQSYVKAVQNLKRESLAWNLFHRGVLHCWDLLLLHQLLVPKPAVSQA